MISIDEYITKSDDLIKFIQKNNPILITNLFTQNFDCLTKPLLDLKNIKNEKAINEYIEIAKEFSSPSSGKFINGVIDKLIKDLTEKGLIVKTGRGLIS